MMRFLLLTLARREEAATATWSNVNLGAATCTSTETKNGQPHGSHFRGTSRRCGFGSGNPRDLVFSTGQGRSRATGIATLGATAGQRHSGMDPPHLRHTGATMLGRMGELRDIIAAAEPASIRSLLAATYNRSRYRPQVAVALQRLADALDGIEAEAAKVVLLRVGV